MKIVDACWTAKVNMLVVLCNCYRKFEHPANRRKVNCPGCGRQEQLEDLRNKLVKEGGLR